VRVHVCRQAVTTAQTYQGNSHGSQPVTCRSASCASRVAAHALAGTHLEHVALGYQDSLAHQVSWCVKPGLPCFAGTDLSEHTALGTVYAGYHYDLNFLTIHGKSRFPGLHVWLADGTRFPVRVPEGCLLLQAGRQLAWLTGGDIEEGMHEVVCTEATLAAVGAARAAGDRPLWRVSSTVFSHCGPEVLLKPIAGNLGGNVAERYPPTRAGEYVAAELRQIKLAAEAAEAHLP
jgi:hypothetical protein